MRYEVEFDSVWEINYCRVNCPFHRTLVHKCDENNDKYYCTAVRRKHNNEERPHWCPLKEVKTKICDNTDCLRSEGKCSSCDWRIK